MKKIGIVGSRRRNTTKDLIRVEDTFWDIYEDDDIIVSGGCPEGGDRFAEIIASQHEIPIIIFKADWSVGRHAGFLRNTDIAKGSDVLIACVSGDRTGGTEDTIYKFRGFYPEGRVVLV